MSVLKNFSLCLLLALFLLPLSTEAFHIPGANSGQNDNPDSKEKKADKKKDKDTVEIDQIFFVSLAMNIAAVVLIISLIYYPNYRKMDSVFSYILFNLVIFMLTFVLNQIKMSMGAAFGLFAVFSMLRYRSDGISMKDMTYLFVFIAMGLISAIRLAYWELGILQGILFLIIFILDGNLFIKREFSKRVEYENLELVKPQNYDKLIEDLKQRTGLNINRVVVLDYDFLKDCANIRVFYFA